MAALHDALGDTLELPSLRALGFRRGDEIDPDQDLLVLRAVRTVAERLGVPPPRLYFDKNSSGLRILPTLPAVLACGTDMFRGRREAEVSYLVGAAIAYLQPEFTLTAVFAPASLAALVDAARSLLAPAGSPLAPYAASVRRALERRLSAAERSTLVADLGRVEAAECEAWPTAVAFAAHRAGLLACDDLVGAARTDTSHLIPHMPVMVRDIFNDLTQFCISEVFLTVRQRLFGARRPTWYGTDPDA